MMFTSRLVHSSMCSYNPRARSVCKRGTDAAVFRRALRGHLSLSLLVLWPMGGRVHRRPAAVSTRRPLAVLLESTRAERVLGGAAREGLRQTVRQLREPRRRQHDRRSRRHDRRHSGVIRDQGHAHRDHEE